MLPMSLPRHTFPTGEVCSLQPKVACIQKWWLLMSHRVSTRSLGTRLTAPQTQKPRQEERSAPRPPRACLRFSVVKSKGCLNTSGTMVWCVSKMRQNRLIGNRRKRYRMSNLQYVFPFNLRLLRMHRYAFQACDFLNCLTQQVCSQSAVHKY